MLHINGFTIFPVCLDLEVQRDLVSALRERVYNAPLFQPVMPQTGKPFSVRMTNLGSLGWVSDVNGYRYQNVHPITGKPWPAMPQVLLDLWDQLSGYRHPPEACLVNYYGYGTRMGLHQDNGEDARDAPVVSISLGDDCVFRMGGPQRNSPTRSIRLHSGDVVVIGGVARFHYHGVDRIVVGTSALLTGGGRINLTLRRVTAP
jgi:DNA oxidative demethylase